MHYARLDACDRRAIAAYLEGCRAGWQEASCLFAASRIQPDEARLRRVLYLARVSDPIAFGPNRRTAAPRLHCVSDGGSEDHAAFRPAGTTAAPASPSDGDGSEAQERGTANASKI